MIGIDINILVRLLTDDDPVQAEAVRRLLTPLDTVADDQGMGKLKGVELLKPS